MGEQKEKTLITEHINILAQEVIKCEAIAELLKKKYEELSDDNLRKQAEYFRELAENHRIAVSKCNRILKEYE